MSKKVEIPKDAVIVKIQQSLSSSDGLKAILVYDKTRAVFFESNDKTLIKPVLKLLKDEPKGYFLGKIVNTRLQIYARVEDQDW